MSENIKYQMDVDIFTIYNFLDNRDFEKTEMFLKVASVTNIIEIINYCDINLQDMIPDILMILKKNRKDSCPLIIHEAIFKLKSFDNLEELCSILFDMSERDSYGNTPIHLALLIESRDTLLLFINRGSDINLADHFEVSPLHLAVKLENLDSLGILLHAKANTNPKDDLGMTPLHVAVSSSSLVYGVLLLNYNADINAENNEKETPLHLAVKRNNFNMVYMLIQQNANLYARQKDGLTPFHYAVKYNHLSIFELFIKFNVDFNRCEFKKYSLIELAYHPTIVNHLYKDRYNYPHSLYLSIRFGHVCQIETIVHDNPGNHHFDIPLWGSYSALSLAVIHCNLNVVCYLLTKITSIKRLSGQATPIQISLVEPTTGELHKFLMLEITKTLIRYQMDNKRMYTESGLNRKDINLMERSNPQAFKYFKYIAKRCNFNFSLL